MCTVITHPAVPIALSVWLPPEIASPEVVIAGAACSIIPDVDVLGFSLGIQYSDMLGHRGLTHSISFAVALAAGATATVFYGSPGNHLTIFLFLLLSTLSHPLLDAMTDGGLGVGLFAPFSNRRYFFPYRPIKVSPVGIAAFFSRRGHEVLHSEARWVWLPSTVLFAVGYLFNRLRDGG